MYNNSRRETPQDIYRNSCLHYIKEKTYDNITRKIYLLDRRFIINLQNVYDVLIDNKCIISNYQDDYFLIFEILLEDISYGFTEILFLKLLNEKAITSVYDFISEYRV